MRFLRTPKGQVLPKERRRAKRRAVRAHCVDCNNLTPSLSPDSIKFPIRRRLFFADPASQGAKMLDLLRRLRTARTVFSIRGFSKVSAGGGTLRATAAQLPSKYLTALLVCDIIIFAKIKTTKYRRCTPVGVHARR